MASQTGCIRTFPGYSANPPRQSPNSHLSTWGGRLAKQGRQVHGLHIGHGKAFNLVVLQKRFRIVDFEFSAGFNMEAGTLQTSAAENPRCIQLVNAWQSLLQTDLRCCGIIALETHHADCTYLFRCARRNSTAYRRAPTGRPPPHPYHAASRVAPLSHWVATVSGALGPTASPVQCRASCSSHGSISRHPV